MIMVIKRDGRLEELNISKIQKYTSAAVKGLDGTSQSELEVDAQIHFKHKITTSDIQQTLIKAAVSKIDIDRPNWTFVASRLFLYDLYHRISGWTGYLHLKDYFLKAESQGKILPGLKDRFDLELLNSHINPDRDLQFNYLGIKTLHDRYLLKDNAGNAMELPQHMFMAVAMFLAYREEQCNEWAIKFYDMLSKFEVMAATPTLANARTTRHQLSSCYIGSTHDSIEGIFDSYKEMALLSKYGGGIGWDFTKIRSIDSFIDNHKGAAGGVVPFLKITNDIAIAVDQLGTRRGAIAAYLEVWHKDIYDFIDLRKNSGDERRRAHDLFPAVWICDLFMKRIREDGLWSLFDPYECPDLSELTGEAFERRYEEYENDTNIERETLKAKDLWKKILTNYFEAGLPFLGFKDNANRVNPNPHTGIIRSSNLCTEIFQNTESNNYAIKVKYEDGSIDYFNEHEDIKTDNGHIKKAKKLTSIDTINGKQIYITERSQILDLNNNQNNNQTTIGKTAVCNLASINLGKVNTKEDLERVIPIAVRMLDNVIDLNFYPTEKVKTTNSKNRAIGLGIMGEAEMLASKKILYGTNEHLTTIDEIMENISFATFKESLELAKQRGAYPEFKNSNWSKGIFPINLANEKAVSLINRTPTNDWKTLGDEIRKYGIRNGYLLAIAPTSSISILVGTTQTTEPIYSKMWLEENLSGLIPTVVPNLNIDSYKYYVRSYDLNQTEIIKAAAIRQKWIDQGQSINIFMNISGVTGKYLNDIYMLAWELGLKSTYYLRSQSPDAETSNAIDRSIECESCQ